MPAPSERKTPPHRGAGFDIVPERPPGPAALPAQCHTGLPRGARCGLLSRLRGRPPACHRRGRSPSRLPTRDHADGATLGRWDATASQRPRRPVMRTGSGTGARPEKGRGSIRIRGRLTNPHRYTTVAGGTPALQASQRPLLRPRLLDDRTNPHSQSARRPDAVCRHSGPEGRDSEYMPPMTTTPSTSIAAPFVAPPSLGR